MEDFAKWLSIASNLFTLIASGIAIYIFIAKRETILSLVDVLLSYTHQLSLSELKEKIERLNEYNAKDPEQCEKILNILNEIIGQIRGNEKLRSNFAEMLEYLESLAAGKKLTEPRKRAAISELRERLRNLNVKSIDGLIGEKL